MTAQAIPQTFAFSERFDSPHCSLQIEPPVRKRRAEVLTLFLLAALVVGPLTLVFFARM